jgi:hypothetical protein
MMTLAGMPESASSRCRRGAVAAELARPAEPVHTLGRAPVMIEHAREGRRPVPANVICIIAEVTREPLPASRYDAVVSITVLHTLKRRCPPAAALRSGRLLASISRPWRDLRELPANSRRRPGTGCSA